MSFVGVIIVTTGGDITALTGTNLTGTCYCAVAAVKQVKDFLENGNLTNCVNFPNCNMGVCTKAGRITIMHKNIPNTISRFTTTVASFNLNISDMLNRSKGEYACTMLDLDGKIDESVVEELNSFEETIRVRVFQ